MNQKKENVNQEKDKIKTAKNKLAEMVYEAKKKILQGTLTEAHDELYKFITEEKDKLGGDDSVLLLPGLFTIAQIHIIEGRLKKAEEYLNAAHWSFLKSNDKTQSDKKKDKGWQLTKEEQIDYKISLHRTFAKLYEVKSDYKEAINELKISTYLECTKWGPEHPYVALNYFLMGKIFVDMGSQSIGESFFAKVSEIWYRYLKNFFEKSPEEQEQFLIGELSLEEAINYLTYIEKHFQESYEDDQASIVFTPVMRTYYSIGLLYKIFGDDAQCEGYLKEVYRQCVKYLPQNDRKTASVKSMLLGMNVNVDEQNLEENSHNLKRNNKAEDEDNEASNDDDDSLIQAGEEND